MQVARLRELRPESLASQLEVSTVDGFQGREKEAIVISMVGQPLSACIGSADKHMMVLALPCMRERSSVDSRCLAV
jgi:hypothetical protein